MTAQDELRTALREAFGPIARRQGYRGSAPTWRKSSPADDWAIVNVQSSSWSTAQSLRCVINIAVAPEPWLRWQRHRMGAKMPKQVSEAFGLFRERVHPTGTPEGVDGWWEVSDAPSAARAVADMVQRMEVTWPRLESMLSRAGMRRRIDSGDLGEMKRDNFEVLFARAEALFLMDEGPSDALESCLARASGVGIPAAAHAYAEEFDRWVRSNATVARGTGDKRSPSSR